jgi:hypothetical protein
LRGGAAFLLSLRKTGRAALASTVAETFAVRLRGNFLKLASGERTRNDAIAGIARARGGIFLTGRHFGQHPIFEFMAVRCRNARFFYH